MHRTGIGYDIHRLVEGRKFILGGIEIPFDKGLRGHSDADVLLHAICDALLGAVGLGDIGEHFPPSDAKYKDISSAILLDQVKDMVCDRGYGIENVDAVVVAEQPHLKEYKSLMRREIARVLSLEESAVNVKATSHEGLGPIGTGQGIAAWAVVSVMKK